MNTARRLGAGAVLAAIVAALALGAGLASVTDGSAEAAPAPEFTLEYTGLEMGVPQSDAGTFTLERDADLVLFEWLQQAGVLAPNRVALDVEVCDSTGRCVDPRTITGPVPFAAGTGTLTVTAELIAPAGNGESGSISGRLSFTADDALAISGSDWGPWLAGAFAAVAVGALVLALISSRRARSQVASHNAR